MPGPRVEGVGGGYVDDRAAGRAQVRQRLAREIGVAEEVDGEDRLPGLALRLRQRLVGADAGVVDQDVEAAKSALRLGHDPGR
jgi:hypothetical protein